MGRAVRSLRHDRRVGGAQAWFKPYRAGVMGGDVAIVIGVKLEPM